MYKYITFSELSAVDLTPCFPFLATDDLSEAEKDFQRQQLYSETQDIRRKFAGLVYDLQKSTEKMHKLEDVINVLKFHDKRLCIYSRSIGKASSYWSWNHQAFDTKTRHEFK